MPSLGESTAGVILMLTIVLLSYILSDTLIVLGDLTGARQQLSRIVGRDTAQLSEAEVIRAMIETVAESSSDGAAVLYTSCLQHRVKEPL